MIKGPQITMMSRASQKIGTTAANFHIGYLVLTTIAVKGIYRYIYIVIKGLL